MAATCNVLPSQRTTRRRTLRNAHRDRVQKAMFLVDLQLKGMRGCIAALFDRQTIVESNSWPTQPYVDCGAYDWNTPARESDPSHETKQWLDDCMPMCGMNAAVNSAVGSAKVSAGQSKEPPTTVIPATEATTSPTPQKVLNTKASALVPTENISNDDHSYCAPSLCQATSEDAYTPWLFLDVPELAQVSQSCSASFRSVQERTPLFSDVLPPWQDVSDSEVDGNDSHSEEHTATQTPFAEAASGDYIVTVTLHGPIDYDSVGDYLLSFGEVDLEDQLGELHGRDVSTWRFTNVACAEVARRELVHYAPNDRGKKVKLELK